MNLDIEAELQRLLSQLRGTPVSVSGLRRLTGGAAAHTWRFDAQANGDVQALILRQAHPGEQIDGGLSKTREAQVQAAAFVHGVPVAPVIHVLQPHDGLGEGYIMACLDGETLPQKYLRQPQYTAARARMAAQCGAILARIHAVPTLAVNTLPDLSITQQLQQLRALYARYDEQLPVFNLALRWLDQHQPPEHHRTLVHGDFRSGNLMVTAQGIGGVLDWELAHIGDPMEDLGWLCVNSWRFGNVDLPVGGFGRRDDLYQAYHEASGHEIDAQRVRFWELYGIVKWGVICLYQAYVHLDGKERSIERAAIGRRVSECELDICDLMTEIC